MNYIVRYLVVLILIFCSLEQIKAKNPSYMLRNVAVAEGLSDLVVNTIYKDQSGFIWLGTNTSLERFDGIRFRHYPIRGDNELLKRVYAVAESYDRELWIGTGVGLWRLNRKEDILERIAPETVASPVKSLLYSENQILYIGTDKGLYLFRDGNIQRCLFDKNVFSRKNQVSALVSDGTGFIWAATAEGLVRLKENSLEVSFYPYHTGFSAVTVIGDTVYLGTGSEGLVAFDKKTQTYRPYIDIGCAVISSLSSDGKDLLYVGTDGNGAHFISTATAGVVRSFTHEAGNNGTIRSNSVYSVLVDRDGLIWFGFYQLGFDYTLYQSHLFKVYRYKDLFDSQNVSVRTFTFHESEKLIGSREGLFFIDELNDRFCSYRMPQLRANLILSTCYADGVYYIGTYGGGMYTLNPKTMKLEDFSREYPNPFLNGHIFCIRTDYKNQLWIGTSDGLYCYRGKELVAHYTEANSKLPEGNVYEIFFDSSRKGWICTESGMCIWDPSSASLKTDVFPEGFVHKDKIRMVYEDTSHNLYFLPEKGNLFVSDLQMNTFRRVDTGLLVDKALMSIAEDSDGWLWITTGNGVYRYNRKDAVIPYSFTDGIPSLIFINCPSLREENGMLWFGNSKGLLSLDTSHGGLLKKHPYRLVISGVKVNGEGMNGITDKHGFSSRLELDGSQRNITLQLSALTYTDPTNVSYEYILEGMSKEWTSIQGMSEVSFYNLPVGTYLFRVRRIGYPDSEASLQIQIGSHWKFIAGIIVIVMLVLGGGYVGFRKHRLLAERKLSGQYGCEETVILDESETLFPVTDGREEMDEEVSESKGQEETDDKYKTNKVSPEECKRLLKALEKVMQQQKPYKNPDLKLVELAQLIGTTPHVLSYLFNQYLNRNYYDYVNEYRVEEFKELIVQEEYAKYTLSALAELCGFSSRASFFRHFKRMTGVTPNEYIKGLGK